MDGGRMPGTWPGAWPEDIQAPMSKSKTTIPAAADAFLQHTESIRKGIQELLETERRRSEDLQRSVQSLQRQLESAETSRQQLVELITNARGFLSNSQTQLGGLLGAVDSLLSVGAEMPAPAPVSASSSGASPTTNTVVTAAELQKESKDKPEGGPPASGGAVSPEEFAARSTNGPEPDSESENRRSWFGRT